MEDIYKEADVEAGLGKGQCRSVKRTALDLASGPHQELDALDGNVRPQLRDQTADRSITAADIQHRRALWNLRRKHFRAHARAAVKNKRMMPAADPGKRPGCLRGGGHLFLVVVPDKRIAADAEHAEQKRSKYHLQAQEQPHRPAEHLADFVEFAEATGGPLPGDPGTPCQTDEEQGAAKEQTGFQRDAL